MVVVLVILGSTVFTIKKITVVFDDEEISALAGKQDEIIADANGLLGRSVFFLSDSDAAAMIKNPYAELVHTEVVFPSTLILRISERKEMFAAEYDGEYFMFDRYGTVLRGEAANISNNVYGDNILLTLPDGDIADKPVVGQKIPMPADKLKALADIVDYLNADKIENGVSVLGWTPSQIRQSLLKYITFSKSGNDDIILMQTRRGEEDSHKIMLQNLNDIGGEKGKMASGWAVHNTFLTIDSTQSRTILVDKVKTGDFYNAGFTAEGS